MKVFLLIIASLVAVFATIFYFTQKKPIVPVLPTGVDPVSLSRGAVNILLLGIGGGNHQSPDLTDTIIFVSLNTKTDTITTLSIPRDVWIPSLSAKINSAYHEGGLPLAKSTVSEFLGQSVHYGLVLDFSTFVKAVDLLGGIDVEVENSFVDSQYPITGKENDPCDDDPTYACRYEEIRFTKGVTHMDGTTALKFVRSRHSTDPVEGTDFARSRRQTKVIEAFQKKLLSSPKSFTALYNLAVSSIVSDIPKNQVLPLGNFLFKNREKSFRSYTLTEPQHLYHPTNIRTYGGQWVLIPKQGNPEVIKDFVQEILK